MANKATVVFFGEVRCRHEGCPARIDAEFPVYTDGIGAPGERVPGAFDGWLRPPDTQDGNVYCPEHKADYVPPHEPTREEMRARMTEQGYPPAVIDALLGEN